jgi:hypothetical protein
MTGIPAKCCKPNVFNQELSPGNEKMLWPVAVITFNRKFN